LHWYIALKAKKLKEESEKLKTLIKKMGNTYQPFLIKMPNGKNNNFLFSIRFIKSFFLRLI